MPAPKQAKAAGRKAPVKKNSNARKPVPASNPSVKAEQMQVGNDNKEEIKVAHEDTKTTAVASLMEKPDAKSKAIKEKLPKNTAFKLLKGEDNWLHVEIDEEEGYLPKSLTNVKESNVSEAVGFLKVKKDAEVRRHEADTLKGVRHVVNRNNTLTKGSIVSYYNVDGEVMKNNRYFVSLDSHYGWVDKSFLEETDEKAEKKAEPEVKTPVNQGKGKATTPKNGAKPEEKEEKIEVNPRTINYKQFDPRWGKVIYGPAGKTGYSTYSEGGCCPTAVASVISKKGANVTPLDLGKYAVETGTRAKVNGVVNGTRGEDFIPLAAQKYGLSFQHYEGEKKILEGLETMKGTSGKYAVVNVRSPKWGAGGHYMAMYGYDGKDVYIDDPNTWNEKEDAKAFAKDHSGKGKGIWVFS